VRGCGAYAGFDVRTRYRDAGSPGRAQDDAVPAWPRRPIRSVHFTKETRQMKRLMASVLFAAALSAPAFAAPAASGDASAAAAIRQLGQDMGDAMVVADIGRIDRMFADDWTTIGQSGRVYTKVNLLDDIKAGRKKLTWFELRPIDVQVFGDVAIAQGNVLEKRIIDGKEILMELVYQDILRKRDGRWVVIRSTGAKVE
jgi:ketosteroid isomerase-like protein